MTNNERVVIVAPNWLGDAVMALPAVADVRRHFADAHLAVAARAAVAPLFDMVVGIDEVVRLPGRGGIGALMTWKRDAAAIRAGRHDTAILLPNAFAAAWVAFRADVGERWGFAADLRGPYLTRAIARPVSPLHQADYYQALVSGLGVPNGPRHARVVADPERGRSFIRELGLDADEPFVVFAPGAAYGRAKQWPPDRFAALARALWHGRGVASVLVGAGGDLAAGVEMRQALARIPGGGETAGAMVDLMGKTDLATLAAVLARARAVVANDSGAMHLAGAVGAPVVAIFGPTNERQTAPLPSAIDAPPARLAIHHVWCRPCMLRECPLGHMCMRGVSPDDVAALIP